MAETAPSREELIAELKRWSHYWRELSQGQSDQEIARELIRLQTDCKAIKGIFNFKILGPD